MVRFVVVAGVCLAGCKSDKEPAAPPPLPKIICESPNPLKDRYGDPLPPCATDRLGKPTKRKGEAVTAVDFSPKGKLAAASGKDHKTRLWDLETGTLRHVLEPRSGVTQAVAFSPDGGFVATAGHVIDLWSVKTGKLMKRLEGHESVVLSIAFSPDGRSLVSGSWDDTAIIWNWRTGKRRRRLKGHRGAVRAVAFTDDGKTIATGSWDQTVILWNARTGRKIRRLKRFNAPVLALDFSADGGIVGVGLDSGGVQLSILGGKGKGRGKTLLLAGHQGPVTTAHFTPDGKAFATAGKDGVIIFWDITEGEGCMSRYVDI